MPYHAYISVKRELQPDQMQLTAIHIDLEEHAVEFGDRHGTIGRLRFSGATVLYEGQPLLFTPN